MDKWTEIKIGDVFEIVTGNTPSKKEPNNYGNVVPFIKPPELENTIVNDAPEYLSYEGAKKGRILPENSVLVTCIGNLGKVGMNKRKVSFNQQINAIKPNKHIFSMFTFYQTQSPYFKLQLEKLASATTVTIVNKGKFEGIKYRLPPLPEQRAIVAKIEQLFSDLDNGIANLKNAQKQLKIYRQAVLKKAFEGELTRKWREEQTDLPSAEELLQQIREEREKDYQKQLDEWKKAVKEWEDKGKAERKPSRPKKPKELPPLSEGELKDLPKLPEGWGWVKLNNISDKITDGEHTTPKRTASGYYLLSARNIQNGYLDFSVVDFIPEEEFERIIKRCNPEEGDILISCSGSVGRICRVPKNMKFTMVRSGALVKLQTLKTTSKFFEYLLQSPNLQKQIDTGKRATAQANLFLEPISNLRVVLCSLQEQHQIVREIETRLSVCDKLEETIAEALQKSEALRQSILKNAFEGKLLNEKELEEARNAPDWEPADKLLERIKTEKEKPGNKKSFSGTPSEKFTQIVLIFICLFIIHRRGFYRFTQTLL